MNKPKMNKLKPCPHCGNKNIYVGTYINPLTSAGHHVINCCSEMKFYFIEETEDYKPKKADSKKHAEKQLIKLWNKRTMS